MNVCVQYTGQLRAVVGRSEEQIELPAAASLLSLLVELAARLGPAASPHLLTSCGQPQSGLLIVVNGAAIPAAQVAAAVLHPGDVVTLLPPIAGG